MLVALGMILCQIPQTVAASEDVTAAGEAVPVVETVEAAQAAEETEIPSEEAEIPSEPGEQYAEAGTAAAEDAAQTDGESGTTESNEAHEPSGNVEEAGAKAPEERRLLLTGEAAKILSPNPGRKRPRCRKRRQEQMPGWWALPSRCQTLRRSTP